jgi:hypothetical protein
VIELLTELREGAKKYEGAKLLGATKALPKNNFSDSYYAYSWPLGSCCPVWSQALGMNEEEEETIRT